MNLSFLQWQVEGYPPRHANKVNLLIHFVTNPVFRIGNVAVVLTPWLGWWCLSGLLAMIIAMALQGRGHKLETVPHEPFQGPWDVIKRIFLEQWITFPQYLRSGKFVDAWKAAK